MGLPALQHVPVARPRRPRLAAVRAERRPARAPGSSAACRAREARCRDTFTAFLVLAVAFSALGVSRVALSARAAAVSIESGGLRKEIRSARFDGDMLEIQRSALATPARIQAIAGTTMQMAKAGTICYIAIDGSKKCVPATTQGGNSTTTDVAVSAQTVPVRPPRGLMASIMHTAAGEAQALLLGDVGLASSR
jgi:cell division protein FtsL